MSRRETKAMTSDQVRVEIEWKRAQTLGLDDVRNVRIDRTVRVRDVFLLSKALMWKPWTNGATTRNILFLDASRAHCQAEATSDMAIELPPEEQVKGEDLIGELLKSLYRTRKAAHDY